jgi:hypothetical protein
MQDHHSKYNRLCNNALTAYENCKDKKFKKLWLKIYRALEERRQTTILH